MKKILYVVLDGLGDLPLKELKNKTPLEAAVTPNMDRLAQQGVTGVVYPVAKGLAPESDIAVISLLGYDAAKFHTGRGPLESFAEGMNANEGDVALRVNFAAAGDDGRTILDRRVARGLATDDAALLAKEINQKVTLSSATFELKSTVGHRGILVIRGIRSKLSSWITNTDPAYDRQGFFGVAREKYENLVIDSIPMLGHEDSIEAQETANLLNEFTAKASKVLNDSALNKKRVSEGKLAGNLILSRDAGVSLPKFPSIQESFGLKFASFVHMPVEKGIALLTGIEVIDVPQPTGHSDVDYSVWGKLAVECIKSFDGLYIHIKGPDDPSHEGNCKRKIEVIEAIDKYFFGSLLAGLDLENAIIAVTADHSTSCKFRAHTADPVPLLVSGGNILPDGSMSFSEKAAKLGSIGQINGTDVMPLLKKLAK